MYHKIYHYFDIEIFRKICFEIESFTDNHWSVFHFDGHQYPNSYYKCTLQNNRDRKIVYLLCNAHYPIFALSDSLREGFYQIPDKFICIDCIQTSIENSMEIRNIYFEYLTPDILYLEFHNKNDCLIKLSQIPANIDLTLKLLNLEQYDYRLFYGQNIGYNLFNSEAD